MFTAARNQNYFLQFTKSSQQTDLYKSIIYRMKKKVGNLDGAFQNNDIFIGKELDVGDSLKLRVFTI